MAAAVLMEVKESNKKAHDDDVKKRPDNVGVARQNWKKLFAVRKFLSLAQYQSKSEPAELLVANQFVVGKKIANGAFGQLRVGRHNESGQRVAIKLESVNARIPMLFLEHRFYKTLHHGRIGVPKIYHFGTCGGKYNALVMELLGPTLEELFIIMGRQFTVKTTLMIAIQLLSRIEHIHKQHIIYRDIKPENCLVGRFSKQMSHIVHIVDFGLAKQYIDPETGRHISYCENKNLTGTVRYMSINAHQGKEQSRRDDLEALGYVFFYFLSKGCLPWQGGIRPPDHGKNRYQGIGMLKENTDINDLGRDHPWEFSVYLRYCKSLRFNQTPDYNYLRNLLRGCLKRNDWDEDYQFDWCSKKCDLFSAGQSPMLEIRRSNNSSVKQEKRATNFLEVNEPDTDERRYSRSLPSSLKLASFSSSSLKNIEDVTSPILILDPENQPPALKVEETKRMRAQSLVPNFHAMTSAATKFKNSRRPLSDQGQVNRNSQICWESSSFTSIKVDAERFKQPRADVVIPVFNICPAAAVASNAAVEGSRSPKPPKASNVQLKVSNGKGKKTGLSTDSSYGTLTMQANPMHRESASEVAANNSVDNVKFTTCCSPLLRLVKRSL